MIIVSKHKLLALAFSGFLLAGTALPALAQDSQQSSTTQATAPADQPSDDAAQAPAPSSAGQRCWQQAGISKSAMKSRKAIMEEAKSQIQKVNEDSSFTPQQQRQQIREIRGNARQQVEKIITPEQRQALQQCERDRKAAPEASGSPAPDSPATQPK